MFRLMRPLLAIEIAPVSSETTRMIASEISLMPIAARWRVPNDFGTSLCVTGRMQRAATMRSPSMTTAPSCNGEFLKKILWINCDEILASRQMPPSVMSDRSLCCPMTTSAPVFVSDISRQATTSGCKLVSAIFEPWLKMREMKLNRFWLMPIFCRNRRISGWKTTISAMAPTLMMCPRIVDSSSMLSVLTITHNR